MRKLNKKNKTYIVILSTVTLIVIGAILVFIGVKIKELNTTYDIALDSIVYNVDSELLNIKSDTYAKKDLLGRYYVMIDGQKTFVGNAPVFFNDRTKEIVLLGTFYEVLENGEINKLKGETTINSTAASRIFKIDDRKYLVIAPEIKSLDNSLNASDYLLINIDKKGNGYLFNNEVNIKTFSELSIVTDSFIFNVNEEKLTIENEIIDLSKLNGSTNEYVAPEEPEETPGSGGSGGSGGGSGSGDGSGTGSGGSGGSGGGSGSGDGTGGSGSGGGSGGGSGSGGSGGAGGSGSGSGSGSGGAENIYPPEEEKPEIEPEIINKYISRKTTVMSISTTASTADIGYIVYDPFSEYESIYVNVYKSGILVGTKELEMALTRATIDNLLANSEYRFDFYYTFKDQDGVVHNILFDTMFAKTQNINGNITLEKIGKNSVRYILKIEGGYTLDSANVAMFIDGVLVATDAVNTAAAASDGFVSTITYEGTGSFVLLKLTDCIYNGAQIEIDASYKYKL